MIHYDLAQNFFTFTCTVVYGPILVFVNANYTITLASFVI